MKFTIEKNILLENLSNVVKAISTKNIIPIINTNKIIMGFFFIVFFIRFGKFLEIAII